MQASFEVQYCWPQQAAAAVNEPQYGRGKARRQAD